MRTIFNWFYNSKKRAVGLTIAWTALIFIGCFLPGNDLPSFSLLKFDKLIHFGIFAIFAFLFLCSLKTSKIYPQAVLVILASVALGYFVEFVQGSGFVKGRSFDHYDALADSIGAALGILIFFIWRRWVRVA